MRLRRYLSNTNAIETFFVIHLFIALPSVQNDPNRYKKQLDSDESPDKSNLALIYLGFQTPDALIAVRFQERRVLFRRKLESPTLPKDPILLNLFQLQLKLR